MVCVCMLSFLSFKHGTVLFIIIFGCKGNSPEKETSYHNVVAHLDPTPIFLNQNIPSKDVKFP